MFYIYIIEIWLLRLPNVLGRHIPSTAVSDIRCAFSSVWGSATYEWRAYVQEVRASSWCKDGAVCCWPVQLWDNFWCWWTHRDRDKGRKTTTFTVSLTSVFILLHFKWVYAVDICWWSKHFNNVYMVKCILIIKLYMCVYKVAVL